MSRLTQVALAAENDALVPDWAPVAGKGHPVVATQVVGFTLGIGKQGPNGTEQRCCEENNLTTLR